MRRKRDTESDRLFIGILNGKPRFGTHKGGIQNVFEKQKVSLEVSAAGHPDSIKPVRKATIADRSEIIKTLTKTFIYLNYIKNLRVTRQLRES